MSRRRRRAGSTWSLLGPGRDRIRSFRLSIARPIGSFRPKSRRAWCSIWCRWGSPGRRRWCSGRRYWCMRMLRCILRVHHPRLCRGRLLSSGALDRLDWRGKEMPWRREGSRKWDAFCNEIRGCGFLELFWCVGGACFAQFSKDWC